MNNSIQPASERSDVLAYESASAPNKQNRGVPERSSGRPYSDKFKGLWIDFALYADLRFSAVQKLLLAEIYALEKNGGCWASNAHFAPLLSIGERMVRNHITKLESAGHIRSENRTTKRRRLWISDNLREQIERETPESASVQLSTDVGTRHVASSKNVRRSNSTRNDCVAKPGNDNTVEEADFRSSRKHVATENTLRDQEKESKENNNSIGDFSLPDWLPASDWNDWLVYNAEAGRVLTPKQIEKHIETLDRLDRVGQRPGMVIAHAIENGWKALYELPESMRPTSYRLRNGNYYIKGMGVIL